MIMKRSNIIITVYSALIFALILFIFIITKSKYNLDAINQNKKEIELSDIRVIVGKSNSKATLLQGNENKIVINYLTEKSIPTALYLVKNDTLFINKNIEHYNGYLHVYFKDAGTFESIEKSKLDIKNVSLDKIILKTTDARIVLSNSDVDKDKKIDVDIYGEDATVYVHHTNIDKLNVFADNSYLGFIEGNTFEEITADLKNKSYLYTNRAPVEPPVIKSDKSSHYGSN